MYRGCPGINTIIDRSLPWQPKGRANHDWSTQAIDTTTNHPPPPPPCPNHQKERKKKSKQLPLPRDQKARTGPLNITIRQRSVQNINKNPAASSHKAPQRTNNTRTNHHLKKLPVGGWGWVNLFYWYQIFTEGSCVVKIQNDCSARTEAPQWAHDVYTTSAQRRCNVMTDP